MKNKYLNKFFMPESENKLSSRIKAIINWIIKNSSYFENCSSARITINIKDKNLIGKINIFPD
jgi:hypothetical protein